jgi:hypothetical protein
MIENIQKGGHCPLFVFTGDFLMKYHNKIVDFARSK